MVEWNGVGVMKKLLLIFLILFTYSYSQENRIVRQQELSDSLDAVRTLIGTGGVPLPDSVIYTSELAPYVDKTTSQTITGQKNFSTIKVGTDTVDVGKRISGMVNVKEFGAIGDGITEDSLAFQSALQYLFDSGGGALYVPEGIYLVSSQLILPFSGDGSLAYQSKHIKIIGDGNFANSTAGNLDYPTYGSIIKLNYSGSKSYLALALGTGSLTIEGITFWTTQANKEILKIIATRSQISNCSFVGSNAGTSASNDAIILGGNYANEHYGQPANTDSSGFQGYGTTLSNNYFYKIRRGFLLQTYANGIQIVNNTFWSTCGSNIDSVGAIELNGQSLGYSVGNVISGNLIELSSGYRYGIKLNFGINNQIINNNIFDVGDQVYALYRFQNTSYFNLLSPGYYPQGTWETYTEDASSKNQNTIIDASSSKETKFTEQVSFRNPLNLYHPIGYKTWFADSVHSWNFYAWDFLPNYVFFDIQLRDNDAETIQTPFRVSWYPSTTSYLLLNGTSNSYIEAENDLRLRANGGTIWLGSANNLYINSGNLYNTNGFSSYGNSTPSGAGSNQARIYGEDISGTTRMRIVDEGNRPFTIYQITGSTTFSSSGTSAISFTTSETDASYKVFITGNVNETFWVTDKTTTGFTIHSSNASSTASVDYVIMR